MTFGSNISSLTMASLLPLTLTNMSRHAVNATLCGVSTHWQNGVTEQHIGIITNHAHMMLLHAMAHLM